MTTAHVDVFDAAKTDLLARFELRAEDFEAHGARYPAWTLLLLPAFGHELFLRASMEEGGPEVRLVTLQTNIGRWLGFTLDDHLRASIRKEPRPPPGVLHDVRERCDDDRWTRFFEAMTALDAPSLGDVKQLGLDGCYGFATAVESPSRRGAFEAWSPRDETPQARFWDAMLELARQTLLDERSQRTLDLVGGDAVSCIEGDTPILRVGRPLYDRPVKSLQALLDGLGGRRAVVDLRPLAPCGAGAGRGISEVRWPAEVLWVVPPELGALLTPMLDARRCVASLDEAWARLRA
ncbi:MAG: hypothetical protein U0326_17640 [Polyangiales bacterium]